MPIATCQNVMAPTTTMAARLTAAALVLGHVGALSPSSPPLMAASPPPPSSPVVGRRGLLGCFGSAFAAASVSASVVSMPALAGAFENGVPEMAKYADRPKVRARRGLQPATPTFHEPHHPTTTITSHHPR